MEDILSKSFLEKLIKDLPYSKNSEELLNIIESNVRKNIDELWDKNKTPEIAQLSNAILDDEKFQKNAKRFLGQFLLSDKVDNTITQLHLLVAREIQRLHNDLWYEDS